MSKLLLLVALVAVLLIGCSSAIAGKSFNQLLPEQKQFYWKCLDTDGCLTFLKEKQYTLYRTCALNCMDKSSSYIVAEQGWCKDSDNGADYLVKGVVTTNLNPAGKGDYCYTFPDGKEYLMEGSCQNNQYMYYQKNCKEFGVNFKCNFGVCFLPNQAPILNQIGDKEIKEGEPLSFEITATDENNDILTYSTVNLPIGATFEGNKFTWTPNYEQAGSYKVTFKVSDGEFSDEEMITITVIDVLLNNAPVLNPIGDKEVKEGEKISFEVSATDKDGDKLTFSVEGLPEGATFDNAVFTWTPNYGSNGQYNIVFKTSDGKQLDTEIITIVVTNGIIWQKTFGMGPNAYWAFDKAFSIIQTTDGGFALTGEATMLDGPGSDVLVVKMDGNGEKQWEKVFDNPLKKGEDRGYNIKQTTDEGFIIIGETYQNYNAWLIKLDSLGNTIWEKRWYGSNAKSDIGKEVIELNNGYAFFGTTDSYGSGMNDMWLVKTDSTGTISWHKTYGGSSFDNGNSFYKTNDGGFVLTGYTKSFSGNELQKLWLVKTDSNGNLLWDKTFGWGYSAEGLSIVQDTQANFIITGVVCLSGDDCKMLLLKTDSSGTKLWEKMFDSDQYVSLGRSVSITNDGGYLISGYGGYLFNDSPVSKAILVKTDKDGAEQWRKVFDKSSPSWSGGYSGIQTKGGDFVFAGDYKSSKNEDTNVLVVKYSK
jgi:hypothetical protein